MTSSPDRDAQFSHPPDLPAASTTIIAETELLTSVRNLQAPMDVATVDEPMIATARVSRPGNPDVICKIEAVFESLATDLEDGTKSLSISLKERPGLRSTMGSAVISAGSRSRRISFPGRTVEEGWRFGMSGVHLKKRSHPLDMLTRYLAVLIRILGLVHEALVNNVITTKR